MLTYFSELGFAVAMLLGLSLAGGWAVLPFKNRLPFVMLAAPLAGILCLMPGVSSLYSITAWPLTRCIAVAAAVCFVATGASAWVNGLRLPRSAWLCIAASAVLIVLSTTWATNATSIYLHGHGLLYLDGTDHLGYAQTADWLRTHTVIGKPERGSPDPYEWFPALMFREDPRFGSFFFLATVATVRGLTGTFAYDSACGVALAAGILAVAGVFARSPLSLLLILAGLAVSHWFDYSRGGYFGKLLGYPAALLVIGLFFSLPKDPSTLLLCLIGALVAGAALLHSGLATLLFFATVVVPSLLARRLVDPAADRQQFWNQVGAVALMMGIALVTTGILARPAHTDFPDWGLKWNYILPRVIDLDNQADIRLAGLNAVQLLQLTWIGFALWVGLALAAVARREPPAIGLLAGPLLLLGLFAATRGGAQAFQLIGMLYPLSLCGAAWLIDAAVLGRPFTLRWKAVIWQSVLALLMAAMVTLRVPRIRGAIDRYAGAHVNRRQQFSMDSTHRLAQVMGKRMTEIDIDPTEPNQAIFALTELSQYYGARVRWSPRTWKAIVGFTGEPAPQYTTPAPLRLILAWDPNPPAGKLLFETQQYKLLDMTP